jgi:hypothetical protein
MNLDDLLEVIGFDTSTEEGNLVRTALMARDNATADFLRLSGQQFGLRPEFVAEVIAQSGLGDRPTPAERELIRRNFITLMEQMRREFNEQPPNEEGDQS